jgi:hypothetical protein
MIRRRSIFTFLLLFLSVFTLAACNRNTDDDPDPIDDDPIEFSIALNSSTKTITQGDSFILVVTLDGITDYDSIGWAAEGDLLTIEPNGLNAVITAGTDTGTETITVTVTVDDVSESADCVVTIDPITLSLSVDNETIELDQGESADVTVAIDPDREETVIGWAEDGDLLDIDADGNSATITAGAATGTTTLTITATIFGEPFTKDVTVTVNEIMPEVTLAQTATDINVGETIDIGIDFVTAYDSDKTWSVAFDDDTFATALVTAEDVLQVTGVQEGMATLTVTMTTGGSEYTATINVNVRPLGYVGISNNVYDPYDLQLEFTESLYFSSIEESVWQEYDILLGGASNQDTGDLRGQFIFKINTVFAKDGDKDVIQVMANGMSAIAVKIPDTIDDLGAIEFSMKMATLDPSHSSDWRIQFLIATVVDGQTIMYGRDLDDNNGLPLGTLTITPEELLRDGYYTYRFLVDEVPENAGNYIVMYLGNTGSYNGTEEDRTYIEGFNFLSKELTGISVTTPPATTEYVVGQDFDPTDLVVSATYNTGNLVPIDHSELTFDYDFSAAGAAQVTVNYMTYSETIDVTVIEKEITDLQLTTEPDTVIYSNGEAFDPTGMVVTAVYNDGSTEEVTTYTYSMDPLTEGQTEVVLSFDGLMLDVPITVNAAALTGIAVTTAPNDVEYVVGQDIDYAGLVITASYGDGSTAVVPMEELVITGFDSSAVAAAQVITVAYGDQTATFNVDIIERVMVGIQVASYPKVVYLQNETEDWKGLSVVGLFNDDTSEPIDFANYTVTGFDSTTLGNVNITITYMTYTTEFFVQITDELGYVEVSTNDMSFDTTNLVLNTTMFTDYFYGETPVDSSTYDALLGRTLNDGERMLQYSDTIKFIGTAGVDQVIEVSANGMSAFAIRIPDGINPADITAFTMSLSGEGLDAVITDTGERWRPQVRFSSMFDGVEYFHTTDRGMYYLPQSARYEIWQPDFTRTGYHDYTVSIEQPTFDAGESLGNYIIIYAGNDGTFRASDGTALLINGFKFWTRDVVADIALNSEPDQATYVVGEEFDPTGLVVSPLYGIGVDGMVSALDNNDLTYDYDFSAVGPATVTISYGIHSVTVDVTVIEKVITDLSITTLPTKVAYADGDVFDPTDMVVTVTYNDGSTEDVTAYTYSMDPLSTGTMEMEIAYEGFMAYVPITVEDKILSTFELTSGPDKLEYVIGQDADYTGMVLTATYADGSSEELLLEDVLIEGFDSSAVAADQTITITFRDQTVSFTIDVVERAMDSIQVDVFPQVIYNVGDTEDFTNLEIIGVFNDDTTEAIAFGDLTITGFDSTTAGNVMITVTYNTFSTTFYVSIREPQTNTNYTEVLTANTVFDETPLVHRETMYTDLFSGDTPADRANYDVLFGRTLNDGERMLQYSNDAIYFTGTGVDQVIEISANGMSAFAVKIPDGVNPADITAFTMSLSGEGLDAIITDTGERWRPQVRFSSFFDGVEYFHTTDRGLYFLPESARFEIWQPEFTRTGYHDYTVAIEQPTFDAGESLGNYIIIYCGNDGTFRASDGTSLKINGFKFWTDDVITEIVLTSGPTKTEYVVGETFDPTGLLVTPLYGIDVAGQLSEINVADLTFDYDFSTSGTKTVTINYNGLSVTVDVTVVDPS